jgi:hypothetical protein
MIGHANIQLTNRYDYRPELAGGMGSDSRINILDFQSEGLRQCIPLSICNLDLVQKACEFIRCHEGNQP